MKIIKTTILFVSLTTITYAQALKVEWSKAIGGVGNERANSIETDHDGNIILVGRFQSPTIKIDEITLTKNPANSAEVSDIFIAKLDKNGKALWALSAGDKGDDHATSCAVDHEGNIYVVGWFESQVLKLGGIALHKKNEIGSDMYVAKFNSKGECIWANSAGGEGSNGDYSTISLDKQNNVIISGMAGILMDFGNGTKLTNKKNGGYVAKYNNDGKLVWAKGSSVAEFQGVGIDKEGNVFAGGFFEDKAIIDDIQLTSNGETDACLVKYSPDGKALWAINFGGAGGEIASCETDTLGNIFLGGLFFGKTIPTPFDTLKNNGEINHFIAKFDQQGKLLWAKCAGGNNGEEPGTATREFYIDVNGNALCVGSNWSEFKFAGKTLKPVNKSEDIFILKYDKNGNEIWGVDYGGTGRNAGRGITTDKNGNIFLTGSFDEKALQIEDHTLTNIGDSDIFVVKFSEKTK
jgi:hypothetical protein